MTARPQVFVGQPVSQPALASLAEHAEVRLGFGAQPERLADLIEQVDGLLVRTERVDAGLLARARRLRVISRVGVGLDTVDLAAATRAGIAVFNTAGANAHTVAELTVGLALAVLRQIPRWDRAVRAGRFADREQDPGGELAGKRWGVIGIGHVGGAVAQTVRHGFGMEVIAHHPSRPPEWVAARGAEPAPALADLLARSDVVSIHVPLTPGTRDLLGPAEFAVMRPGSVLVNVARGGVVNEAALVEALRSGPLQGAGVDVFEAEPPPPDHPLFSLDNVVLSAHRGGRTGEATQRQGRQAVERLVGVLRGGPWTGAVNEAALAAGRPAAGVRYANADERHA